jgi:hypothetical protein
MMTLTGILWMIPKTWKLKISQDIKELSELFQRLRPENKNFGNSIYLFESPELPAQLELNEDRIVIKINLSPFILAQP